MTIRSATFAISAHTFAQCPESELPEFAFIGRSNVGKSSLLNRIAGKGPLAKVSATPGHTKMINFYTINGEWSLVDLPGYGFAQKDLADRERFQQLILDYLGGRENLVSVFVLIDSRHPPQKLDLEFTRWLLMEDVPFVLVFTKTDKPSASEVKKNVQLFTDTFAELGISPPRMFLTSSETGAGRIELLKFIQDELAALEEE
ncbi:MAG: YihA family ribosome biogenesis GTP-binding protein [Verrucomicrobia bacterium]|nr:YihA family ribosome biogenesis GTP-binding protein [Verrucomicrobiota bacterium]